MSQTQVSTYAEVVAALTDQIRPVITERNLVNSDPKTVRRTIRRMIQVVREDETVALSCCSDKERTRADQKKLLFDAKNILNAVPLDKRDGLIDEAIAGIRAGSSATVKVNRSSEEPFPMVAIKDWLPSESRREADVSPRPLFVSPGRR